MNSRIKKFLLTADKGFAAMLAVILVLGALAVIFSSLVFVTVTEQKISANSTRSVRAFYSAESGVEDSLYRIIKGKNYQATNFLSMATSSATISITGGSDQKIIRVNGEDNSHFRSLEAVLKTNSQAVSFYYGVQVGEGGLIMSNNSQVTGNIYSNGNISGGNDATITGDAFVAGVSAIIDQQSTNADSDFIFGKQGNQIDAAQSFMPASSNQLQKISLYLKKIGNPGDKTVRILTDNGNQPSKTLVGSGAYGTLNASQISPSNYGWINVAMNTPPNLQAGVKYWVVVDTSADINNYFSWGKDSTDAYAPGTGKYSPAWNAGSPVWSTAGGDLAFETWLGGTINSLSGVIIGGNAHAHNINSCSITGDAYYQTISNSTVQGQQYPDSADPAMEPMPISESNITDWKADAEAGGVINGNYILTNNAIGSLGPKKIVGNLSVSNGADLTVTGTIYVTGTITLSNNVKLRLSAGYGGNSGVVLTDGSISVSNNCVFYNSGPGSFIMLLSTATGSAINISNNADTVIFYAAHGTVTIDNNAILREVTGQQIFIANNAQIIYDTGLASAKFSSGPAGGWVVSSWQEVP